jgi:hypothetical protein
MKKNPFQYLKPVQDPGKFFGREEEIASIYRQILSSHSVSLIGERKIGKTSLFLHLIHPQTLAKYEIPSENILMVYIDISSCSFHRPSDVFYKFLNCISEKTTGEIKNKVELLLKKENIHFQEFEEITAKINNNNQKIVFLLDEFEKISMIKQGDIFSKLRYLAQMYDVTFVVSTLRDLMSLFKEKRFFISPFFNIFTKHQLRGLDENASRELITTTFQSEGFEVDSSTIDSIIRFSGTSPFSLKLECYYYFERLVNGFHDFDDALKNLIQEELEPHHRYNWDHLPRNEQATLLDIIKNGNTDNLFAGRSLERRGYISKESTGLYVLSDSFQRFLKEITDSHSHALTTLKTQIIEIDGQENLIECDRNALREAASKIIGQQLYPEELGTSVFGIIGYLEREMRKYNKNVLEMALGKNWFKEALDRKSREDIEKRISRESKRIKNFQYPENPFDYALLENLRDVITRHDNWNHLFSKYFQDKRVFEVKMQEIIDIKNRIAHYHTIHFNEAVTVIQDILWMLTHMQY